jgi:protein-L-isoaspartate(D-aspartate) O-methyltransferase
MISGNAQYNAARKRMVREQLSGLPPSVLAAMSRVPRHEFVPDEEKPNAYEDRALPIGFGQTISQPYIVAVMTAQLDPQPGDQILEIGTGSGYQAAVLAEFGAEVYSIEILEPLALRAAATLQRLGLDKVHLRLGDGNIGWPDAAPFDGIVVTCAPEQIPAPLVEQLKEGARILIPVGPTGGQELFVFVRHEDQLVEHARLPVRFVPMTGKVTRSGRYV